MYCMYKCVVCTCIPNDYSVHVVYIYKQSVLCVRTGHMHVLACRLIRLSDISFYSSGVSPFAIFTMCL